MKRKRVSFFKACLVLIFCFSILPEVIYSQEDVFNKLETGSASAEGTNSCDEHNCPVPPDEPFHHCAVCCTVSHVFTNQSTGIILQFSNSPRSSSTINNVLYNELFAKTLFHPPKSII